MRKLAISFVVYIASALFSLAQAPRPVDPPELATMREENARALLRASVPILDAYLRQLDAQKSVFARQGKLDAVLAVDNEIKEVTKQRQAANANTTRTGATQKLAIVSAAYGSAAKKKFSDITKNLRKAMESGATVIKLNTEEGAAGVDPVPSNPKETRIVYTINGERKEKTFKEGYNFNFADDLN